MKRLLLVPILLLAPALNGCDTVADFVEPRYTPEQQAELDGYEARMAELEVERAAAVEEGKAALVSRDLALIEAAAQRLDMALHEQENVALQATMLISSAKSSRMSGFMRLVEKIPGPWQPFIPVIGTALTLLAGKRSRKFAWVTVRNSLSVGVLDTLRNAARAVGMMHSSEASEAAAIADPTSPITS